MALQLRQDAAIVLLLRGCWPGESLNLTHLSAILVLRNLSASDHMIVILTRDRLSEQHRGS